MSAKYKLAAADRERRHRVRVSHYRFDPLTRLVLSWGFNLLVRIMFRIGVRDIDCAFKLFRREVFDKVTIESKKFFVNAEVLAKARYFGFRLVEIGVRHYPRPAGQIDRSRKPHLLDARGTRAHLDEHSLEAKAA